MKRLLTMALLVFFLPLHAQDLKVYQWKKRVLLLFPGSQLPLQKVELTKESAGLEERDIVIVETDSNKTSQYAVAPGKFTVILLGKDGSEKFRSEQVVSAGKLFFIIDTMPMRKNEAKLKETGFRSTID